MFVSIILVTFMIYSIFSIDSVTMTIIKPIIYEVQDTSQIMMTNLTKKKKQIK